VATRGSSEAERERERERERENRDFTGAFDISVEAGVGRNRPAHSFVGKKLLKSRQNHVVVLRDKLHFALLLFSTATHDNGDLSNNFACRREGKSPSGACKRYLRI
jgi:hypothetical protein